MKKLLFFLLMLCPSLGFAWSGSSATGDININVGLEDVDVITLSSFTDNGNATITGYANVTGNVTSGANVLGSMTDLTSLGKSTGTIQTSVTDLYARVSVSSSTEATARGVSEAAIGASTGTLNTAKLNLAGGTLTGQVVFYTRTEAEAQSLAPTAAGSILWETTNSQLIVSTGTGVGAWGKAADGTLPTGW